MPSRTTKERTRRWPLAALLLLPLACGGTEDPKPTRVNVLFPSTKAAVATDTLQMLVYDAPDDNACLDLVQRRRTSQDPSRRVITGQRSPLDTCSFIERASAVDLSLSYGRRAFFVLAQRQGSDFMIGCTLQGIGDADQSVDVALTPIDNTVLVPETTCDRLSSKCAGSCS